MGPLCITCNDTATIILMVTNSNDMHMLRKRQSFRLSNKVDRVTEVIVWKRRNCTLSIPPRISTRVCIRISSERCMPFHPCGTSLARVGKSTESFYRHAKGTDVTIPKCNEGSEMRSIYRVDGETTTQLHRMSHAQTCCQID